MSVAPLIADKNMKPLKDRFEAIVSEYIKAFEKKHGLTLDFWVADVVGETACFGDVLFFNFDDIRRDIDGNWPENEIMDWSEYVLEYCEGDNKDYYINYWNWLRGARYEKPVKMWI